jgi:hypothetical protein
VIIETTRKDLFYKWLEWLNPILQLNESEHKVLAAFLTLHWYYTVKRDYQQETINELLFTDETKDSIREKIRLPKIVFSKAFKGLLEKGIIKDGKLSHLLTRYPKDDKFSLKIDFKLLN